MELVNVVLSAELGCQLNLHEITRVLDNVIFAPEKFSALRWNHRRISGTILLFKTGKLVLNGCRSHVEALSSLRRYSRILMRMDYIIHLRNIKIQTMTAVYRFNTVINLSKLAEMGLMNYHPEIFPSCNIRINGIHYSLSKNGVCICTGGKNIFDINKGFYILCKSVCVK